MGDAVVITLDYIRKAAPKLVGRPLTPQDVLKLSSLNIGTIQDVGMLGTKVAPLRKLDLSGNNLQRLTGLHNAGGLTWLNASENKLVSQCLIDIGHMKELAVLNLGNNNISSIPGSAFRAQKDSLKALILNNNKLTEINNIPAMKQLNALILSHNKLTTLPASILGCATLHKISLAHNRLSEIPDFSALKLLAELRLNDNGIKNLPESLTECVNLRLLDLGNNKIAAIEDLAPLASLTRLQNLNLKGNPLEGTVGDFAEFAAFIRSLCPKLRILNGKKLDDDRKEGEDSAEEEEVPRAAEADGEKHKQTTIAEKRRRPTAEMGALRPSTITRSVEGEIEASGHIAGRKRPRGDPKVSSNPAHAGAGSDDEIATPSDAEAESTRRKKMRISDKMATAHVSTASTSRAKAERKIASRPIDSEATVRPESLPKPKEKKAIKGSGTSRGAAASPKEDSDADDLSALILKKRAAQAKKAGAEGENPNVAPVHTVVTSKPVSRNGKSGVDFGAAFAQNDVIGSGWE